MFILSFLFRFFHAIILVKQTYQTKKCYDDHGLLYIFSTCENGKNLKQTEIDVKIIKLKKHVFINLKFKLKLAISFYEVMKDTDKNIYFCYLYEILIIKYLKDVHQIF